MRGNASLSYCYCLPFLSAHNRICPHPLHAWVGRNVEMIRGIKFGDLP
jgi:hypothetical protein